MVVDAGNKTGRVVSWSDDRKSYMVDLRKLTCQCNWTAIKRKTFDVHLGAFCAQIEKSPFDSIDPRFKAKTYKEQYAKGFPVIRVLTLPFSFRGSLTVLCKAHLKIL